MGIYCHISKGEQIDIFKYFLLVTLLQDKYSTTEEWLVILFNSISNLVDYLIFLVYDFMCIYILVEIIFINCFSWCHWTTF